MAFFEIDHTRCTNDNICVRMCVAGIIKNNPDTGWPEVDDKLRKRCIACGHCVAYCPTGAASVASLDRSRFIPVDSSLMPSVEQADTFLRTRRSVRLFKKEELSREIMEEILQLATTAPTAKNSQKVSWAVVYRRADMKKIADLLADTALREASKATDRQTAAFHSAMAKAYGEGRDIILRNAPAMVVALTPKEYEWQDDGVIATTYVELAAHARHLGTCWAGYFINYARNNPEVYALMGIDPSYGITGALLMGYPVFALPRQVPPRKDPKIQWMPDGD